MRLSTRWPKKLTRMLLVPWYLLPATSAFAAEEEQQSEEIYELSPFTVETSENDIGYYASSTLAGTRMNSKLRDIAASITVVTAQQLEDTAAIDLNDVFLYEANTEGTGNYTAYAVDRFGGISDQVQLAPETANRIRGIGSADRAIDYFVSLPEIPVDSYNVDRLTINRGPNSVLYGLGSAAGIVNTTPGRARINSDSNRLVFRVGSNGALRSSFNVNRTIIEDKLAIYVAGVYDERGFERKPSFDVTRRAFGAITFQPFENTSIRLSYESYNSDQRLPNAQTPQDYISHWIAAGSPTWNPLTFTATYANGQQIQYTGVNNFGNTRTFLPGLKQERHQTIPGWYVEDGVVEGKIIRTLGRDEFGLAANEPERLLTTDSPWSDNARGPLGIVPGVQDKSIYDWEKINLVSGNFRHSGAETINLMVEQQITEDLFLEVGYFNEHFDRYSSQPMSNSDNRLHIDVNEFYLDGRANPNFMKPFMEVWEPTSGRDIVDNQIIRATAAYELDFTDNDGWTSWLGRHRLMGLGQDRQIDDQFYRYRESVISVHDWAPLTDNNGNTIAKLSGTNAKARLNRVFYVGEPYGSADTVVTKAPGISTVAAPPPQGLDYPRGSIGVVQTGSFRRFIPDGQDLNGDGDTSDAGEMIRAAPVAGGNPLGAPSGTWVTDQISWSNLLRDAWTDQTRIESLSAAMQSYFWEDRIVTTMGVRKDTIKARVSDNLMTTSDGYRTGASDLLRFNQRSPIWEQNSGTTRSTGIVVHPLSWLSFHYNESDNFTPAGLAQNLFLEPLPKPTGDGEDYGVAFTLLENKLIARVNWYKANEANSRAGGDTGTITWRTRRMENESSWGFVDWIEFTLEDRDGLDRNSLNVWGDPPADTVSASYQQEAAALAGLPVEFLQNNIGFDDSRTISSEGMEISLDYNPTRSWNMKFTAGRQETIESEAAPNTQLWLWGDDLMPNATGGRLEHWMNASYTSVNFYPGETINWWTTGGGAWGANNTVPMDWYGGVVEAPLRLLIAQQGLPKPTVREWRWAFITNYRISEGPLSGLGFGGSIRWEDKASIGNLLLAGSDRIYDPNAPIYDSDREYVDVWASYSTRLMDDRVRMRVQLNLRNVFEDGRLQVVRANPDGTPAAFRIVDPGEWFLTTTFEF